MRRSAASGLCLRCLSMSPLFAYVSAVGLCLRCLPISPLFAYDFAVCLYLRCLPMSLGLYGLKRFRSLFPNALNFALLAH